MKPIYVTKAYLPPKEEYFAKLEGIWKTHMLTNMGPLHQEFERRLAEFLRVPYAMAFTNGHTALEMAIQAMNLEGEVITTPYTFASTTHAIVRNGLRPVFCDIRMSDYTMDPEKIEALITEKTSAIVPVHVYGQICDVDAIQKIADKYGLKVIYDAAHAFGEQYHGKGVGNFGDCSIFSFHATKPFNSIEGGAAVFHDRQYGLRMYQLKNFGFMGEDLVCGAGANGKLSEFHAAMGLCNLDHYDEIESGRRRVVEQYRALLSDVPGLRILPPREDTKENYAYFPVLFDKAVFGEDREAVYRRLAKKNIHARRYFYPLTKDFLCYAQQYQNDKTPVAEDVTNRVLTLPLYDSLSEEEVALICGTILEGKRG